MILAITLITVITVDGWEERKKSVLDDLCQKCQVLIGSRTLQLNKDMNSLNIIIMNWLGKRPMLVYLVYTCNYTFTLQYMSYAAENFFSMSSDESSGSFVCTTVNQYPYLYRELLRTIAVASIILGFFTNQDFMIHVTTEFVSTAVQWCRIYKCWCRPLDPQGAVFTVIRSSLSTEGFRMSSLQRP